MIDEAYVENLEHEVERLESEVERFKQTYKVLALACAKGNKQRDYILNKTKRGWQDDEIFTSWGKKLVEGAESRQNLFKRITEANVAHLRKKSPVITVDNSRHDIGLAVESQTVEYIQTEYGPPPEGVPTKTYRGMTYYVY